MAFKVNRPPRIYHCQSCNWKMIFASNSDTLYAGKNLFSQCPKCGSKKISSKKPNWLEMMGHYLSG
ncbi:hypothetical protein [Vandammella animalimorsus]|uniref:hypothetical protein n=1 Tax=Vandammella animalimorsus TaxID=2029117 RepID=UPI00117BE340|nr:hypothetical protein [Vandammella animalimorsus]